MARDSYKWVSYKKGFGCWWVVVGVGGFLFAVVGGGGYILAGGRWCWVVMDIFWLVVGGGEWWWVVA